MEPTIHHPSLPINARIKIKTVTVGSNLNTSDSGLHHTISLMYVQYSQRGTFINPLTPVVRIIHARSNTASEHPLTLVVMTLAYSDDRTRGFAVVAREGSSRSTVFHRLHCTCKLYKIRDHLLRPSGFAVSVHRVARCPLPWAIEHR